MLITYFLYVYICKLEKHADRYLLISWLTLNMHNSWGWARPKLGARTSIQVFPCEWQGPKCLSYHLLPPRCTLSGTWHWIRARTWTQAFQHRMHLSLVACYCYTKCLPLVYILKFHMVPKLNKIKNLFHH